MSSLNISIPNLAEMKPRISVFGVGGGGCNAVNNMIESNLTGVDFVVANTDAQALAKSPCERRIQMGNALTEGLGAGSQPEIGAGAAEEALAEIVDHLAGAHMAFITAGMGGGTGTGAAPVIARAAKEQGILTVGVVTKPFNFEGKRRMSIAEHGIDNLTQHVDTLIVIPNQNLFRVANEKTSFTAAFAMADQVLYSGVASITELMTKEGLINLDFADVRAVMSDMGKAMMGTGEASGDSRAIESAEAAISNPLLDDVSMSGARGVLISIAGGPDLTLYEVDEAATRIREEVDVEANIIVGATIEEELEGTMRVSVVATGLQEEGMAVSPDAAAGNTSEQHIYAGGMGGGLGQAYGAVAPVTPEPAPAPEPAAPVHEPALEKVETSAAPAPGMAHPPVEEQQATLPLEEVLTHEAPAAPEGPREEAAKTAETAVHHEPAPKAPHIPPLEEFPESIQKTAAAKAEQISSIASAPKKRRSLLERLKKLGRGGDAPSVEEQHTAAEEPRITPRDVHPAPAPDPEQTTAENVHHLDTPAGAAEGDDYTIPAFLRRQQN